MNLPAAVLLAVLMLGPLTQVLPAPVWSVAAGVVLPFAVWAGSRAVRAEVLVDSTSVVYRGIVRTLTIPRSALLAYSDYSRGLVSWLGQDAPEVTWDAGNGRTKTTRLWLFVLRSDIEAIGSGEAREVRAELGRTLRGAIAEAHRERKHGKRSR